MASSEGAGAGGDLEWAMAVEVIPSPLSPLPRTSALSSSMARKGSLCPLVPKVQLQLLQTIPCGLGNLFSLAEKNSH